MGIFNILVEGDLNFDGDLENLANELIEEATVSSKSDSSKSLYEEPTRPEVSVVEHSRPEMSLVEPNDFLLSPSAPPTPTKPSPKPVNKVNLSWGRTTRPTTPNKGTKPQITTTVATGDIKQAYFVEPPEDNTTDIWNSVFKKGGKP